jgi:DNA-directed RNA polymerase subunit RPC12/RpoP
MESNPTNERICCPRCGSSEVSKSRRRGIVEKYLGTVLQMRPYRCYECSLRFWKKRGAVPEHQPETQIEAPQSFF